MGFSKLTTVKVMSPNFDKNRNHKLERITPHCMVGQLTAKQCGDIFAKASRQASSNYGIGTAGDIGGYVDEDNHSWCSSSADNDNRAITIECASDTKHPYAMNQKVWNSLVDLCVDICVRYGKKKVLWFNDKNTSLKYKVKEDELIFTVHRWFAAKACPGDWLYKRMGKLAEEVNDRLSHGWEQQASEIVTPIVETPATGVKYSTEEDREKIIWQFFKAKGLNDYAVAGLMGNLYFESALRPNNLQNSFEKKLNMTDKEYTDKVDTGLYTNFVHDGAGYGLAQWTWWTRKQLLLHYINQHGLSIDSLGGQCEFIWIELTGGYKACLDILKKATSVKMASDAVLTMYEKPADQSTSMKNKRANCGKEYYNKYAAGVPAKVSKGFYIQYGAFSTKKNAEKRGSEVVNKVDYAGLNLKVEKFDGYYRTICGYFKTANDGNLQTILSYSRKAKFNPIVKERKV